MTKKQPWNGFTPTTAAAIAKEHKAADASVGRDWNSPQGCACGACRQIRINKARKGRRSRDDGQRQQA